MKHSFIALGSLIMHASVHAKNKEESLNIKHGTNHPILDTTTNDNSNNVCYMQYLACMNNVDADSNKNNNKHHKSIINSIIETKL